MPSLLERLAKTVTPATAPIIALFSRESKEGKSRRVAAQEEAIAQRRIAAPIIERTLSDIIERQDDLTTKQKQTMSLATIAVTSNIVNSDNNFSKWPESVWDSIITKMKTAPIGKNPEETSRNMSKAAMAYLSSKELQDQIAGSKAPSETYQKSATQYSQELDSQRGDEDMLASEPYTTMPQIKDVANTLKSALKSPSKAAEPTSPRKQVSFSDDIQIEQEEIKASAPKDNLALPGVVKSVDKLINSLSGNDTTKLKFGDTTVTLKNKDIKEYIAANSKIVNYLIRTSTIDLDDSAMSKLMKANKITASGQEVTVANAFQSAVIEIITLHAAKKDQTPAVQKKIDAKIAQVTKSLQGKAQEHVAKMTALGEQITDGFVTVNPTPYTEQTDTQKTPQNPRSFFTRAKTTLMAEYNKTGNPIRTNPYGEHMAVSKRDNDIPASGKETSAQPFIVIKSNNFKDSAEATKHGYTQIPLPAGVDGKPVNAQDLLRNSEFINQLVQSLADKSSEFPSLDHINLTIVGGDIHICPKAQDKSVYKDNSHGRIACETALQTAYSKFSAPPVTKITGTGSDKLQAASPAAAAALQHGTGIAVG